jgi:DNA-binding protein HU-beta
MNRHELVHIVARQTNVDVEVVEDVLQNFINVLTLTLSVDEEVVLRGFGKFKSTVRPPAQHRNPRNGESIMVGSRRTASFVPSVGLKGRLNSDPLS